MSERRRRELGESDEPVEDELDESFDATVEEGAERLHRTLRTTLITGFFGGLEVGLGVMAMLAVLTETGSHLLAGLAFSIGFLALDWWHALGATDDATLRAYNDQLARLHGADTPRDEP